MVVSLGLNPMKENVKDIYKKFCTKEKHDFDFYLPNTNLVGLFKIEKTQDPLTNMTLKSLCLKKLTLCNILSGLQLNCSTCKKFSYLLYLRLRLR